MNKTEKYWCFTCQNSVPDIHRRIEYGHWVDKTPQSWYEKYEIENKWVFREDKKFRHEERPAK